MKSIMKRSILAASVAVIATSAAFADDPQLQNRLAAQRAEAARNTTTVAVYANERGVGRSAARGAARNQRTETRFELRSSAQGQIHGAFVPVK